MVRASEHTRLARAAAAWRGPGEGLKRVPPGEDGRARRKGKAFAFELIGILGK